MISKCYLCGQTIYTNHDCDKQNKRFGKYTYWCIICSKDVNIEHICKLTEKTDENYTIYPIDNSNPIIDYNTVFWDNT